MSNQNPKLTLDFNIEDIPWLIHAMTIQRNTAMMYGKEGERTKKRVKEFLDQIKTFFPVLASHDIEEYKFFDAVTTLYKSKSWTLYQEKPRYKYEAKRYWKPVVLVCDGVPHNLTSTSTNYNEKLVLGLIELFKQITPIGTEYIEHPSIREEIRENPSWYKD